MKISEMITELKKILAEEGDLRVTIFDEYLENEGWDYSNEELWDDAEVRVEMITDDDDNDLEKVVCFRR